VKHDEDKVLIAVGIRGCCAKTSRKGIRRNCAQKAITIVDGKPYCFYHNPSNPHKFGEKAYWRKGN
jgi:hypothetical protein